MATWRILFDDGVSAAGGLALDEALMAGVGRDANPARPTLRLYTYASMPRSWAATRRWPRSSTSMRAQPTEPG